MEPCSKLRDFEMNIGKQMYGWARDLFGINRSITGEGVRETLGYLSNLIPNFEIHSIESGTKVFDWIETWTM